LPAAPLVVCRSYLIVVPRPLPAAALVARRRAVFIFSWCPGGRCPLWRSFCIAGT
jgi:hypothetical protein